MNARTTADVIALLLAAVVAVVVLATTFVILFEVLKGEDPLPAADGVGRIVAVLVGLLAGYVAGRRINGHYHDQYFSPGLRMESTDFLSGIASAASALVIVVMGEYIAV